ncbi:MAG: hypothetical protein Q4D38_07030 [Planctomycetia bacterium]|nr:hypothetical protein [Planctomycetia bacterium]
MSPYEKRNRLGARWLSLVSAFLGAMLSFATPFLSAETFFVPTRLEGIQPELPPPEVLFELDRLDVFLDDEDWESAASLLRKFLADDGTWLVPLADVSESPATPESSLSGRMRTFVSRESACRWWVERVPGEVWRPSVDPIVRFLLTQWGTSTPPEDSFLEFLLKNYPYSEWEGEILEILAQRAWENRRFESAFLWWERALEVRERDDFEDRETLFVKRLPTREELENRIVSARQTLDRYGENEGNGENGESPDIPASDGWKCSMLRVYNPQGEAVFEDFLPQEQRGALFEDRRWDAAVGDAFYPQFLTIAPDRTILAARLGTLVSFWSPVERVSRPQAYLIALDLSAEGRLLWMKTPDAPTRVFVGNPSADDERIFIVSMEIGAPVRFSLDAYDAAAGALLWRAFLFSADVPREKALFVPVQSLSSSRVRVGSDALGVVVEVDSRTGDILSWECAH